MSTPLMISISGVRGIVGESLTPQVALRWAEAFGAKCRPGPVVVGGDSRVSSVMMRAAAFSGLAGSGARIIDVGIVPTPTVSMALRHHGAGGGIAITASHNPAEWNAFKFFGADGLFLDENSGARLRAAVESDRSFSVSAMEIGTYGKDEEAVTRHVEAVLKIPFLDLPQLKKRRFRVGLDAVCGAGGDLLSRLLDRLGCKVSGFHLEPSGRFPRNPEPIPEHLGDVGRAMKNAGVDIGFVADPDADRLAVILETGECAGEESTLVAATDLTLRHAKGSVVANCSTTQALDDVAAKYGVTITRTKVGEAHVAREIVRVGAVIGGEGNGGVMLPMIHPARDAAVGMVLILQALLESRQSVSDYFATLPRYHMIKRRISFSSLDELKSRLETLEQRANLGKPDRLDGLKWSNDEGWVQARASNTEPIVRVIAEAGDPQTAERLARQVTDALG
ncbi:phosphoglucosamine mutase [bacterium]|nr:phosphoglucosamine mutase [bacterium]MBU1984576.1 phosphoglucosamine mutase [bacterium]